MVQGKMTMKEATKKALDGLFARYPVLAACRTDVFAAADTICASFRAGGKLIACGNGGSAADAEHIVGELMKGFLKKRRLPEKMRTRMKESFPQDADYLYENLQGALPALSLVNQVALGTAFANDQAADLVFAQQVMGIGRKGDVLLAISTSGNSKNVVYAALAARLQGVRTVALTGRSGGRLRDVADIVVAVPDDETYRIQELHLPVYHALCIAAEEEFFGD